MGWIIVFLVVAYIVYWLLSRTKVINLPTNIDRIIKIVTPLLIILLGLKTSAIIITDQEVGVVSKFGKYSDSELDAGLHFVFPLYSVHKVPINQQSYTVSKNGSGIHSVIEAQTKDVLTVKKTFTLLYRIKPNFASETLKRFGNDWLSRFIAPSIRPDLRKRTKRLNFLDLFESEKYEKDIDDFREFLTDLFDENGFILDKFEIREIIPPTKVQTEIENKITEKQKEEKMDIFLNIKRKEAEAEIILKQGKADANNILNKSLTDKVLEWENLQVNKEYAKNGAKHIIIDSKADASVLVNN